MDRARLTLTDIGFFLLAVIALRAFYPVFSEQLDIHAGAMGEGTVIIMQTVLPVAVLILFAVIFLKAGIGSR